MAGFLVLSFAFSFQLMGPIRPPQKNGQKEVC